MSTQDEYTLYPDQEYSEENDEVWYENGKRTSKNGRMLCVESDGLTRRWCCGSDSDISLLCCYGRAEARPASYA